MYFSQPLFPATLIKRYKRFLADVKSDDGTCVTVHTANTGAMLGCADPGMKVWLKDTQNPARKYRLSWDIVENHEGTLIGINTILANGLVREAIESGVVSQLQGYDDIKSEVKYGTLGSRVDFLLKNTVTGNQCFVEVKNVTASLVPGVALFPDAISKRGSKHLEELMDCVAAGSRMKSIRFMARPCVER